MKTLLFILLLICTICQLWDIASGITPKMHLESLSRLGNNIVDMGPFKYYIFMLLSWAVELIPIGIAFYCIKLW